MLLAAMAVGTQGFADKPSMIVAAQLTFRLSASEHDGRQM